MRFLCSASWGLKPLQGVKFKARGNHVKKFSNREVNGRLDRIRGTGRLPRSLQKVWG